MLFSLAVIFLCGMLLGGLCKKLKLPPLLGMLLTGILLGPHALDVLDGSILAISADLRRIALIIILTRAGLNLELADLKRAGRPAVLLCFVPACFEIAGMVLLAPRLLGISVLDAAIMGSVVAAVSPAVIVPKMLRLMEEGRGTRAGIPQMIMAGASVDDVFVIVLFTSFTGMAQGGSFSPAALAGVPVSIVLGGAAGLGLGYVLAKCFTRFHLRDSAKVVVLLALAGAAPAVPACLLLLAGWMGAWAASCSVQRRALWGKRDTENYRQNLCRHYNIQKSAALAAGGLCLALALPCWWLLRPALGVPLGWLQPAAQRVESAALSTAITWLPRVSGGRLNIQVEAAAGGVADGALNQGGGIQVSGVTDLALTASDKPEETVYLRGFIGGSYDGTTWQAPDADAFDSAAMNWKTEDNARLTIASLPFLRTAYDGTAQPQTLTVERIHADTQYTYAPYNAYWGDYYTIQGDGAAAGQTAQDDVFLYYPRDTAQTQLEARADADPSVQKVPEADRSCGHWRLHPRLSKHQLPV